MKGVHFTKQTSNVAIVFFTLYFVYGMFRIPFTQFLISLAIGGLTYGVTNSYEFATFALLLVTVAYSFFGTGSEGFTSSSSSQESGKITSRINSIKSRGCASNGPTGVGSSMSEGFADAGTQKASEDSVSASPATSKPAPVNEKKEKKESFESPVENIQEGLFKLGVIPKDVKGGFHIDAGTTVMNALQSLKPEQIEAMTNDTKQLIETQKSLMNMLQTFQPMVSEGKQMMETFQTMFSPAMGSLTTAQGMLEQSKA